MSFSLRGCVLFRGYKVNVVVVSDRGGEVTSVVVGIVMRKIDVQLTRKDSGRCC
jgi:hypothetical protein